MRRWSDGRAGGECLAEGCAAGRPDPVPGVVFSDQLDPHLAWHEVPAGTRSCALIGHDVDVPPPLSGTCTLKPRLR